MNFLQPPPTHFDFCGHSNRRLPRGGNGVKPVHKNPIWAKVCFFCFLCVCVSKSWKWKCEFGETGCRKMGSCLSVEGEEQPQRENGSSCRKPGTVSYTDIFFSYLFLVMLFDLRFFAFMSNRSPPCVSLLFWFFFFLLCFFEGVIIEE